MNTQHMIGRAGRIPGLLASLFLAAALPLTASVLVQTNFDTGYTAGSIGGQSGTGDTGLTGTWSANAGTLAVVSGGLSYAVNGGGTIDGGSQALQYTYGGTANANNAAYISVASNITADIYVRYLLKVASPGPLSNTALFLWLSNGATSNHLGTHPGVGLYEGELAAQSAFATGAIDSRTNGTPLTTGTTYLVVAKLSKASGATRYNAAKIWVNPAYGDEGTPLSSVTGNTGIPDTADATKGVSFANLMGIQFNNMSDNGGNPKYLIDAITIGTSWDDVVPAAAAAVAPTIDSGPNSQSVAAGTDVTFTVAASGTAPLSYQWKKDGADIGGATASSLTLPHVSTADDGDYTVVVANAAGTVTSNAATFQVLTPVSISAQPESASVLVGSDLTLGVTATGTAPLAYQWKKDDAVLPGETHDTLALTNVQLADSGDYTVVVSNPAGPVTSTVATVLVTATAIAPAVITPPASKTLAAGSALNLTVVASGTAPLSYQWTKDDEPISGATNATFAIASVALSDNGSYRVAVTNGAGSDLSAPAVVIVNALAPAITTSPASQTTNVGGSVTLEVFATGNPPPSYQWFKDDVAISGATADSYTIAAMTEADAGSYTVAITNAGGTVTSAAAVLTVSGAYLSNLSARASMEAQQTLILGFVVSGGNKPILVRAAGPALNETAKLTGYLADPKLTLYNADGTALASNDDWANTLADTFTRLGAFPFIAGSKDAALMETIAGVNTVHAPIGVTGGIQLVELYDAGESNGVKLVNVSARNHCGTGDNILIAGFVIAGHGKKQVLIRGIGPGLSKSGVTGVLADPKLTLFSSAGATLTSNDNWDSTLAPIFATLGAFELPAGSKDAALLIELDPGVYTAQVAGADGGTGEALVEIYDAAP